MASNDQPPAVPPISGLRELQAHLRELTRDASLAYDAKLFDDVELQVNPTNIPSLMTPLLPLCLYAVRANQTDPTPVLPLILKLIAPMDFAFAVSFSDMETLLFALTSPLPGAVKLGLAIVGKARTPAEMAELVRLEDGKLVEETLRVWLSHPDPGVGTTAASVLRLLFERDCAGTLGVANGVEHGGELRLWNLIFGEQRFLSIMTSLCTVGTSTLPTRQLGIAQDRLLNLLARLATLRPDYLTSTPHPSLFSSHTLPHVGILPWAALAMIDYDDVLMCMTLIMFFETLASLLCQAKVEPAQQQILGDVFRTAVERDPQGLGEALRTLPDRTIEEEAETLRAFIRELVGPQLELSRR